MPTRRSTTSPTSYVVPDELELAPGSIRHLVWLYGGREARARHAALFAIEREIAASIVPSLDHGVAHARLGWWEEECERLAATLPRHPQTVELLRESRFAGRAAPDLGPLVAAARWDLARATPETRPDLDARCREWACGVFVHLGGGQDSEWLIRVGAMIEELQLLGALAVDASQGRVRIPLAELEANGLNLASLRAPPFVPALRDYLRARHRSLRQALRLEVSGLAPPARPALRAALIWAALAGVCSERAEQALPDLPRDRPLDALKDTWTAWTVARRALNERAP
jgi:phytoene synthase